MVQMRGVPNFQMWELIKSREGFEENILSKTYLTLFSFEESDLLYKIVNRRYNRDFILGDTEDAWYYMFAEKLDEIYLFYKNYFLEYNKIIENIGAFGTLTTTQRGSEVEERTASNPPQESESIDYDKNSQSGVKNEGSMSESKLEKDANDVKNLERLKYLGTKIEEFLDKLSGLFVSYTDPYVRKHNRDRDDFMV